MKANLRVITNNFLPQLVTSNQLANVVDINIGLGSKPTTQPSVLIVDDDDITSYMLKFLFERQGYDVTLASDGKEASKAINSSQYFSHVLLDIAIPYKSGIELISDIRALPQRDKTAIIVLSTKAQEKDIVEALDAGAADYIVKPFKPGEVLARIRKSIIA